MSTLKRLAERFPFVQDGLHSIRTEEHSEQIFNWLEGRIEGFLWAQLYAREITSDQRIMAVNELRDLKSQWRVVG